MKWMLSFCTLLFVFSLLYRTEGQPHSIQPELLEEVVGLSESQVMELRMGLLETHGKILELQARIPESNTPHELQAEMKKLRDMAHRQMEKELGPEHRMALAALPSDPMERRHGFRARVLQAPGLSESQASRLKELLRRVQAAKQDEYTETRYWALVGLLLDQEQMIQVKRHLPYRYQTNPRPDNYFALPELEPKVANRILSAFLNLESETTASRVRVQQLEKQDVAEGTPEQVAKMREMISLHTDMVEIRDAAVQLAEESLTAEQRRSIAAIPPFSHAEYQNKLAQWLTNPDNQTPRQRSLVMPRMTQLQHDWQVMGQAVKRESESFDNPNARGAMTQMMTTRNKMKPLEARRMEIAREVALLASPEQMDAILRRGAVE